MLETAVLAKLASRSPVEKLCITLGMARHFGVDRGFQGSGFMDAEVGFHGLWVLVQIVDPRVVALLLSLIDHGISIRKKRGNGVFVLFFRCPEENLLDFCQSRFDAAQAVVDEVVPLRHLPAPGEWMDLELLLRTERVDALVHAH